ncbi:MAG: hypothetical protein EOO43_02395 [Flavobacterium sp.]|nr:MAG: hypothetical protein EOO43_02395 [Flavobacterium sp.]
MPVDDLQCAFEGLSKPGFLEELREASMYKKDDATLMQIALNANAEQIQDDILIALLKLLNN